jgi:hypothetical protein
MTTGNAPEPTLAPEEVAALDGLVADFARDWRDGLLAEAGRQLPDRPAGFRRAALIAMVKIDLERQWQCGRRPALESYLDSFPELGGAGGVPAELIGAELRVRAAAGEAVEPSAVWKRFPGRAAELGTLAGRDDTRDNATPGGAPPARLAEAARDDGRGSGALPEQFGRYRIRRRLGRGGMGTVYLAFDTELQRQVAIKIPSHEARGDAAIVERFLREARAAAALRHPNVCPVYDVGRHGGTPYLTMAYIEGRTLQEFLHSGGPPPPTDAAVLVRKLALAIDEAHRRGLLHRDLKPSNIMIDPAGEPVVMDFGLVRSADAAGDHLTQTGAILGTPAYMAPEQARSDLENLGPATDVYSAGVILYQLLAGRLPFTGNVHSLLLQTIHDDPPPPSKFRAGLDPRLEAVCLKALAKKPADRFPSMAELAAALESCIPEARLAASSAPCTRPLSAPTTTWNPPSAATVGRRRWSRDPKILAAAFVAAVVAAVVLSGIRSGVPAGGPRAAEPATAAKVGSGSVPRSDAGAPAGKPTPTAGDADLSELLGTVGEPARSARPNSSPKGAESRGAVEPGGARHGRE